ncbi:hypothetical protein [Actinoplanes sp. NPDC051851]|uniref:hypothetical protein n=1 Tax=Actinoplanes sp. NPDC051851 TaxID=3154753 RepID=UPI0034129C2F
MTSPRVPSVVEEDRFWSLLESAWEACGPEAQRAREALVSRDPAADEDGVDALDTWIKQFLANLESLSVDLSSDELTDLDRVLERRLYDIDREEIHEFTDGSDDGFLYCRGFIVAAGRRFYDAVDAAPGMAVLDAECESMCYFFANIHHKRFGDYPDTGSGISRESGSNPTGW